jgi:hypothetical protein
MYEYMNIFVLALTPSPNFILFIPFTPFNRLWYGNKQIWTHFYDLYYEFCGNVTHNDRYNVHVSQWYSSSGKRTPGVREDILDDMSKHIMGTQKKK